MKNLVRQWLLPIGLAIGIFLLAWRWIVVGDGAFFPPIERNQGTLSLLALIVAISVAVKEHFALRREGERRRKEFIEAVVRLADEFIENTTKAAGRPLEVMALELNRWNEDRGLYRKSLDIFRYSAPADGPLILGLRALDLALRSPFVVRGTDVQFSDDPRPTLKETAKSVATARDQILKAK